MRHLSNLEFAQLTVFFGATGGLLSLVLRSAPPIDDLPKAVVKVVGLLISFLFFVMNERGIQHWVAYSNRAVKIEKPLGYRQYTDRPPSRLFSDRNATRVIYGSAMVFWIVTMIWHCRF